VELRIALRSRVPGSAQRSRNLLRSLGYRSKPVRAHHNPGCDAGIETATPPV